MIPGGRGLSNLSDEKFFKNRLSAFWCCLCFAFLLTGCAALGEYNPATGRQEFIIIPTDAEVAMGKKIHEQIATTSGVIERGKESERIRVIGARLARISDQQDYAYRFYLINQKDINAFTTPGGNVYFFKGLLGKLSTDDQVAAVLAHEIGHCAARHTVKKFQASLGYSLIGSLVFSQLKMGEETKAMTRMASNTAVQLAMSAYSRQDEYEADRLGVKYMSLAGYNLNGMIETLQILKRESQGKEPLLILSTHPYLDDRIRAVKKEISQVLSKDQPLSKVGN